LIAATLLTDLAQEEVLARATHKSKRQLEDLVAELAPKPDVPPTIRKRPKPKAPSESSKASDESREEPRKNEPTTVGPAAPEKRPTVSPLSPARYQVNFTASAELRDKLERLEALIPGSDIASVIDVAVSEKLERLEAKRFGKTNRPRTKVEDADTSPGVRGIAAAVKRFVWERDGGQCTFVTPDGKRCPERHRLEYHHDKPYGRGGDRNANNLRLMCKCHNLYMAELDFGKETIDEYRRSADRVCEPTPSFELSPGRVETPHHISVSLSELRNGTESPGESTMRSGDQRVYSTSRRCCRDSKSYGISFRERYATSKTYCPRSKHSRSTIWTSANSNSN